MNMCIVVDELYAYNYIKTYQWMHSSFFLRFTRMFLLTVSF